MRCISAGYSEFITLTIIVGGLVGIVLYSTAGALSLSLPLHVLLLTLVFIGGACLVSFYRPRRILPIFLYGLLLELAFLFLYFFLKEGSLVATAEELLGAFRVLAESAWSFLKGSPTPLDADPALVLAVLVGGAFACITSYTVFSLRDLLWPLVIGAGILVVEWLGFYDRASFHLKIFLVFGLVSYILCTNGKKAVPEKRSVNRMGYSLLVSALVISLFMVLFADFLPSTFAAVSMGGLEDRIMDLIPGLRSLRGNAGIDGEGSGLAPTYSLKQSGYTGGEEYLGGPLELDNAPAFTLKVSGLVLPETLYLRGSSREVYTGRGWVSTPRDYYILKNGEYLRSSYPRSVRTVPLRMTVTPLGLATPTVFTVLEPERIFTPSGKTYLDFSYNARTRETITRSSSYRIVSQIPITDPTTLAAQNKPKETTPGIYPHYSTGPGLDVTYLQLPESLPRRVRDLAASITAHGKNAYEKALAVESYLRTTYEYRRDVPQVNAEREGFDFVDYFLFELKSGYCTYFASAMTILLRSEGIPARFVVGFAVPLTEGQEEYTVLNSNAHAWVEAFIPGYGWVTFDPTPGPYRPTRSFPDILAGLPDKDVQSENNKTGDYSQRDHTAEDEDVSSDRIPRGGLFKVVQKARRYLLLIPAALFLLLLVWAAVRAVSLRLLESRVPEEPARRIRRYYELLCELLTPFGLGPKPSATPAEYMEFLSRKLGADRDVLNEFVLAYSRARYGQCCGPEVEQEWFKTILPQFKERLRLEYGWLEYYKVRLFPFLSPFRRKQ